MGRLEGRVALVTGAARGIGFATAERLAQEGAKVCLTDVAGPEEAADRLANGVLDVFGARLDVTEGDQVEAVVGEVVARYGRLDILVNNAGVTRDNFLYKMSDAEWKTVLDVHLTGAFLCSRAAQGPMVENGYGRIVNVSSVSALGNRGQANYSAAKAGLQGFTRTLAAELGRFGITANAVAPGFVETEMTRATAERMGVDWEAFVAARVKDIPAGRSGKPEDIAAAAALLAAEYTPYITRPVIVVDGGLAM